MGDGGQGPLRPGRSLTHHSSVRRSGPRSIAKVAPVVAYDRAGLGWSDTGPKPRDGGQNARELHAALRASGIGGPYVVVGHSYGGLAARAFASLYRHEVAGMVLVDASHPDQWARFGMSSKVLGFGNKVSSVLARFGLFRRINGEYKLLADGLPPRPWAELMALGSSPRALSTSADAAFAWDPITRPLVNQSGALGDLPLVVLSVTEQPRKGAELTELQADLPALSSNSRHITIQGAYHEGLLAREEYARVVTESIVEVVQAVRERRSLTR